MRRMLRVCPALATAIFLATSAFAQGNYKVEAVPAPTAADVPKALLDVLDAQGARVSGDQGVLCEVWLRKGMELGPPAGGLGDILYGQLGTGDVVGLLHLPNPSADFRGQTIKPGYYVLRHALIPQDGAHMGVYATRDALLLSPAASDTQIATALSFDDMVKLSRQASGTPHPGFLVMSAVSDGATFPSIVKDDAGHWDLQMKVQGKNGELPIGITVVGKWEGM
ncbi:MAG: hypothetical protein LAN62_17190 [Acidobacteriia bacterium]|nr:hypothetical protein [Terriglobia bacterium]